MKKMLAILMAVMMLMSVALVHAEEEIDWTIENWDAKTVKYQFTGAWELPENNISLHFLLNLYEDGTVLCDQLRNADTEYFYYGTWTEENTEDGNEIALNITVVYDGSAAQGHEYAYDLYEEEDGGYSFGFTFGIAPGQYFRDADMVGSSEITYEGMAAFKTAVLGGEAE